jgi:hypothetical protein
MFVIFKFVVQQKAKTQERKTSHKVFGETIVNKKCDSHYIIITNLYN